MGQLEISSRSELRGKQYDFVSAIEILKVTGIADRFYQNWDKAFSSAVSKNYAVNKAQAIYNSLSAVFTLMIPLTILVISFAFSALGRISVGQAVSLYSVSTIITSFALSFFSSVNSIELLRNYFARITDAITPKPEDTGSRSPEKIDCIELKNVSFRFNKTAPLVLKDVSMRFEKGKKTAIVGASGCGKSTIASLLIKLYQPTEGTILYDGVPGEELENRHLRQIVCCVPQDGSLFNRSVKENITLFSDNYTTEEILSACRAAEIYDDLMKMPMKLETPLSDIGSNISGGQKQRIFLARALLKKPEFLILDEATSALDSKTEQAIYEMLNQGQYTQIVIAHRLSTITDADRIYVMKEGRLVEDGTHEQLMELRGEYYSLYCGNRQGAS